MNLFYAFLTAIAVSIALIPLLMRFAVHLNMIDEPGTRKVHELAIPRCGGVGIALGALIASVLYVPMQQELLSLILSSNVIIVLGLLDDRFELSYKWKFAGQFVAVVGVIMGGIKLSFLPFAGLDAVTSYLTIPLTVIFAIGVVNAVNLSDGLDGLAAGIMLMTFAAIAFLAVDGNGTNVAVIAFAVAGGIAGFLWFNTHPAVVFMGDTGSQFLGFMAVFLTIFLTQNINQTLNPALPLLLLGLPILDTLTVMVRRIRAGRSPFMPDKTHIHHRFMQYGFTHAEAVGVIYLLQGVFLASALAFRYSSDFLVLGAYAAISASILLFFFWASKTGWSLVPSNTNYERRRGGRYWRSEWLFNFCRQYINISLTIFLLSLIYCLLTRLAKLDSEIYWLVMSATLIFLLLPKNAQDVWVRFSIFIAAIFSSVMGQEFPEMLFHQHWLVDVFLLMLFVVVSIAIRVTRKSKFRMTTQDLLVVLFVIAAILLFDVSFFEHVMFRLLCLVYAFEYLLHRDVYQFRLSRYTAAVSGILILSVVLPTLFQS
jgi:UDP-GlcNAc:undecaprenyl-phosphate/decaprenyl-phosphate GlcNAc-1-phosphate transferase